MSALTPEGGTTDRATARTTGGVWEELDKAVGQATAGSQYRHERLTATSSTVRPERRRRGPGPAGLRELLDQLSPRDIAVLELIADHRFLTTSHLERFCFHDHATPASGARTCRRVLARLERGRILERPIRRIGGLQAGSAASVWMVTSIGKRLLSLRRGQGAVGRVRAPGERFIAHYLAIADARLALVETERAGLLAVFKVAIEPRCWRHFSGLGGNREVLKPDLEAITALSRDAEYEDHWFIEVDRGTESLPTLIRQCRLYAAYLHSGIEQAEHGVFPLVLWVVPDEWRAERLRAAIRAARDLDDRLYRVTTPDSFVAVVRGGTA